MRKVGASTVIKESIDPDDPLIVEEVEALIARFGKDINFKIYRVTFTENSLGSTEEISDPPEGICFLSSSFIINITLDMQIWHSYIYYSIVATPQSKHVCGKKFDLLNNYINIKKSFDCTLKKENDELVKFKITGSFFSQQNGVTSVCAHATLCMAINNSPLYHGELVLPESINFSLGIDHRKVQLNGGLEISKIFDFLGSLGIQYVTNYFIKGEPGSSFSEHLYRYIESKCPSMLLFTTDSTISHIVPIIGHTLNTDLWRPEGELAYSTRFGETNYRSAAAWVDHLIIHDDNFGMFYCLPTDSFEPMSIPNQNLADSDSAGDPPKPVDNSFKAQLAISLIPHGVITTGSQAEWAAITLLEAATELNLSEEVKTLYWTKQLRSSLVKSRLNPIVARTFLTTRDHYENCFPSPSTERLHIIKDLPDNFWLIEISIPDLYTANKSQIAEIAIKSDIIIVTASDLDNAWIYIRLPGAIILKSEENTDKFLTLSNIKTHIPIIRPSSIPHMNEW